MWNIEETRQRRHISVLKTLSLQIRLHICCVLCGLGHNLEYSLTLGTHEIKQQIVKQCNANSAGSFLLYFD